LKQFTHGEKGSTYAEGNSSRKLIRKARRAPEKRSA